MENSHFKMKTCRKKKEENMLNAILQRKKEITITEK